MNYESILQDIGLSASCAKVYMTLLRSKRSKSGEIIKRTGLQSSVVHNALNRLNELGFVNHVLEGKIKQYSPVTPDAIRDYLDAKGKEFDSILPDLKKLQRDAQERQTTTEVFEGFKGLLAANLELIQQQTETIYKYFAAGDPIDERYLAFFEKVDLIKKEKGITVRGLAKVNQRDVFRDYRNSTIRYTKEEIPPAVSIYGNRVLISSLAEKPVGILIRSDEIANQYHAMWDAIWKRSEK